MKICLTSLNYSPAHLSLILAYYNLLTETNHQVEIILEHQYQFLTTEYNDYQFTFCNSDEFEVFNQSNCVIVFNPSIQNLKLFKYLRNLKIYSIYLYHEPWQGIKYYNLKFNKATIKFLMVRVFNRLTIKNADSIIVPSNRALKDYNKYELKYNKSVYKINLLFNNEMNDLKINEKIYFSFIGTVHYEHALDEYLKLSIKMMDEDKSFKAKIATRTNINQYIENYDLNRYVASGQLEIYHNKIMTNEEINEHYLSSYLIWCGYHRSTQSGVLGKAFMSGTPVLVKNVGSFSEYCIDGYNSKYIDGLTKETIKNHIYEIKNNIDLYSNNSLESFNKYFYYRCERENIEIILNNIKKKLL